MITHNVSSKEIRSVSYRLDSSYHLSSGNSTRRAILSAPYGITNVGEFTESIFYGNRAKRIYVKKAEAGLPFLSSSEILKADFDNVKLVSQKKTSNIEELVIKYGWTLVTRSGTVGKTAYASEVHAGKLASDHVIRVVPNGKMKGGCLYSYLSSYFGYSLLTQGMFGGVIQSIEPKYIEELPIPCFPDCLQCQVDKLMQDSAKLRKEADDELKQAQKILYKKANLPQLTVEDYDFYGLPVKDRKLSTFIRSKKNISTLTINAFNYSERISNLKKKINCATLCLSEVIENGEFFSTGSFPRVEVKPDYGIMLINQSDIFDMIIQGKHISKRGVKTDNMVEYGEVMIAGVGTLGENETFCRTIFANEDLVGQLVSGEFIRMKTNGTIPPGYLFTWLNSEYGFRLIRHTQAGTKLCRPIQKMLLKQPVPIIDNESMLEIDSLVKIAHTKRHKANIYESKAIKMIEEEIEKWNN